MFRFLVVVIVEPSYGFKPDGMGQLHIASAVKKLFGLKFYFEIIVQVALTLHGFTLHGSHFTRGLGFCQMNSHYVILYTFSSLYTVKNIISVVLVVLSYCVSPYTNFSLHDLFRKTKIV